MALGDKVAIVTGGNSGIGQACALARAGEGPNSDDPLDPPIRSDVRSPFFHPLGVKSSHPEIGQYAAWTARPALLSGLGTYGVSDSPYPVPDVMARVGEP